MTENTKILKMPVRFPAILNSLKSQNSKKKVKIRYRALKDGEFSLFLEVWHNGKKSYEFIKMYIKGTNASKKNDGETIRYAIAYRDKKELELIESDTGISFDNTKSRADFLKYFEALKVVSVVQL